MSFFGKLFKTSKSKLSSKDKEINEKEVILSLDNLFVHNFINKGGKFLYCISFVESILLLNEILKENKWDKLSCIQDSLVKTYLKTNATVSSSYYNSPFLTSCEHLIADSGNIMFCSKQINEIKLSELSNDFIVLAYTSQIVKNMGEGLTGIKTHFKNNLPTNICDIRNYKAVKKTETFMDYGASNSKNLYLILIEDL